MDKSYLSDKTIVAASREFVCIRLLTYESKSEGKFLESIFQGRNGTLENTVFALLAPDGTKITRGGRSPDRVFRGRTQEERATAMVNAMKKFADEYESKVSKSTSRTLPTFVDFRRALNAASCDLQPLVVIAGKDAAATAKAVTMVSEIAWSDEFVGDFAYATVDDIKELAKIPNATTPGIYVIQANEYGTAGRVLAHRPAVDTITAKDALVVLREGANRFKAKSKDSRQHIRDGRRKREHWEPEIPVTDGNGRPGR